MPRARSTSRQRTRTKATEETASSSATSATDGVVSVATGTNTTNNSDDPTLNLFYKPHTISVLVAMLAVFVYVALWVTADSDSVRNTKMYHWTRRVLTDVQRHRGGV
jgi:hypothetical protein